MKYRTEKERRFGELYEIYMDDIYRVCLHFAKNEDVAQDVMQQTFVNFYEHMDEVGVEYAKAYLVTTARNLTNNHFRRTKREVIFENEETDSWLESIPTPSLEEEYFEEKLRCQEGVFSADILNEMKRKHENWYHVVWLLYVMGMSYDEVEERLGISKVILYNRAKRAKSWVRKHYRKQFDELFESPGI